MLVNPKNSLINYNYDVKCHRCLKKIKRSNAVVYSNAKLAALCNSCYRKLVSGKISIPGAEICKICGRLKEALRFCTCEVESKLSSGKYSKLDHGLTPKLRPIINNQDDNILLGFEFEMEFPDYSSEEINPFLLPRIGDLIEELDGRFYITHDSSVSSNLEICSHPVGTCALRTEKVKNLFKRFFDRISEFKPESETTYTTGFHIHMSRSAWSPLTLMKLKSFISYNPDFINVVSWREEQNKLYWLDLNEIIERAYSKTRVSKKNINKRKDDKNKFRLFVNKYKWTGEKYDKTRYMPVSYIAVDTIEFRLFRGVSKYESFMVYVDIVLSLWEFLYNTSINNLDFEDYKRYLEKEKGRNQHKEAYLFIVKKSLDTPKTRRKHVHNSNQTTR